MLVNAPQYYLQTDSATRHSHRMCFSSTCAMAVKCLKPEALKGSNADDDYLKTVLTFGDTTTTQAQIKACAKYGIKASFYSNGTRKLLEQELSKGFPVATGVLHKGPVTNPTGGGHWMLLIGSEPLVGVFHDPYGEMDVVNGGYHTVGYGGKNVSYSWKNWLPRWEVERPGSGWYMTFRNI